MKWINHRKILYHHSPTLCCKLGWQDTVQCCNRDRRASVTNNPYNICCHIKYSFTPDQIEKHVSSFALSRCKAIDISGHELSTGWTAGRITGRSLMYLTHQWCTSPPQLWLHYNCWLRAFQKYLTFIFWN